jgi:hypothetical protein
MLELILSKIFFERDFTKSSPVSWQTASLTAAKAYSIHVLLTFSVYLLCFGSSFAPFQVVHYSLCQV